MNLNKLLIILFTSIILMGCSKGYTVDVDLTKDKLAELTTLAEELKVTIDTYEGEDGTFPYLEIIDLARVYVELGEIGKAIDTYEGAIEDGVKGRAVFNNLGRLYEKVESYDMAIVMYQRIVDEYFDENYLYDITWAYIRAKDRKNAAKFFNAWQLEFQKTDEQTQEAIKKLREDEIEAETAK